MRMTSSEFDLAIHFVLNYYENHEPEEYEYWRAKLYVPDAAHEDKPILVEIPQMQTTE